MDSALARPRSPLIGDSSTRKGYQAASLCSGCADLFEHWEEENTTIFPYDRALQTWLKAPQQGCVLCSRLRSLISDKDSETLRFRYGHERLVVARVFNELEFRTQEPDIYLPDYWPVYFPLAPKSLEGQLDPILRRIQLCASDFL